MIDTIDNTIVKSHQRLQKMQCYNFDLSHFMQKNLNAMIDYLVKNNNDVFQYDIGIDLSGKIKIGDLADDIYSYSNHTIFGIKQRVYHDNCLADIRQTATDILNEYLQWLVQLIKTEEVMNCREANDLLTGTINISTKVVFSQKAYIDWLIPRLSLFNKDNKINLNYIDDNENNINYLIAKLLIALPSYQELTTSLINSLIYYLSMSQSNNLAQLNLLIRQIYQLVIDDTKLIHDSDIEYEGLLELASFAKITKIQMPLIAITKICRLPQMNLHLKALKQTIFVADNVEDVQELLDKEQLACQNYSVSNIKHICNNIHCVNFKQYKSLIINEADIWYQKSLVDETAKPFAQFLACLLTKC